MFPSVLPDLDMHVFLAVAGNGGCREAASDKNKSGGEQREARGRAGGNQATAPGSSIETHPRGSG